MTAPKKSIVVPCYNEAENLPTLLARFDALAAGGAPDWELLLVNNGSTDATASVLETELTRPARAHVRVVTVPSPNVGYGHGITAGLRAARGDILAWTHADGQTPPSDALRALELVAAASDPRRTFVKGRRRRRAPKDELFTLGVQVTGAMVLGASLADVNGQPKAFHRALFELATAPPIDLSLDLYYFWLARKNGFATQTFDVDFGAREHGESKWAFNWRSKARNVARTIRFMSALRRGGNYPTA